MATSSAPLARLTEVCDPVPPKVQVDELDLALLRALAVDARQSQRALARAIEMSPPAVADRLARLERSGAIRGYRVDVDWAALGFPVVVYLAVTAGPGMDLSEIIRAIRAIPEAQDMSVVTGGLDLLVRLRVRDHEHLRELLLTKIFQINGVQRTETFLSLADVEPDNFAAAMLDVMSQRTGGQQSLPPRAAPGRRLRTRSEASHMPSPSPDRPRHGPALVTGVGQAEFVRKHALYSPEQASAADAVASRITELGLRTVRLTVVDQHGVPRSKSLSPEVAISALSNGLDFSGAIYSLDTGNQVFVPAFAAGGGFGIDEFTGFPDVVLVPDPATFQVLPWADRTGWMLCDVYFSSGQPMPLDGRGLMRRMLVELGEAGYGYLAGIEVEYYIVRLAGEPVTPENAGFTPPPPPVSVFELGYQYLSEVRLDGVAGVLEAIRDGLAAVGLPPRSMEDEWGPGQMEFSFSPIAGLAAADSVVLFRSAVKQICQRRGLLATFMCRPALPNFFSSGWHLHESLLSREDGRNVFASDDDYLSATGRQFVAGLLDHAMPMTVFAAPTVNGYKRFRPYSFAPDRVCWALENRGALVRVQGAPGDSNSHVENRMGEPAANPYLYMAANIAAGLDGIRRGLEAPAPVEADPYAADAAMLPASLADAVGALEHDGFFRKAFGDTIVDYLIQMKRAELARHDAAVAENPPAAGQDVTDWEMREYFEFF